MSAEEQMRQEQQRHGHAGLVTNHRLEIVKLNERIKVLESELDAQKRRAETLRRQVAELGEQAQRDDSATYHLSQMVKSLTAENAELKRQVEGGLKLARDYVRDMEEVFCIPEEASAESVDMYEQAKAIIALQAAKGGA